MKAIIVSPAQSLKEALSFYEKLNYSKTTIDEDHFFSDGASVIRLDSSPTARAGLELYLDSDSKFWDLMIGQERIKDRNVLVDPNGIYIFLRPIEEYPEITIAEKPALTGKFAGMSIETLKFNGTVNFWKQFGYGITMGGWDQGWIHMKNDSDVGIGVMKYGMCPHTFRNPGISYFNGKDNLDHIDKIRKAGVPIAEEIDTFNDEKVVDNIVLVDPGGISFFIFSD